MAEVTGRRTANELLRRAAALYDRPDSTLRTLAPEAWRSGFESGGVWMSHALNVLRGTGGVSREQHPPFQKLGIAKYTLCLSAAGATSALAIYLGASYGAALLLFGFVFYAVEAQGVFLLPAAIDHSPQPWQESRRLLRKAGGTLRAQLVIMQLATVMLLGGLVGRGFVRSWCLGCLAVVLWYEDLLSTAAVTDRHGSLELFARGPLTLRCEQITGIGAAEQCRLLYLSDLHLGSSGSKRTAADILGLARISHPDAILLGGDLVDHRSALPQLFNLISALVKVAPTGAVLGNHDRLVGEDIVLETVRKAGAVSLEDSPLALQKQGVMVLGSGRQVPDSGLVPVLCTHDPADYSPAIPLTLAGHLHGSQCVLWQRGSCLYPGRFFFRWNILRHDEPGATLIVSRGVNDTLPIRFNCPREGILCQIA